MKINNLSDLQTGATTGAGKPVDRASSATQSKSATTAPGAEAGVTVSISPASQTLSTETARASTDVFNTQKVQAVRQAIENGSFSVNPEAIADKLLANARDMLSVASK